MATNIDTEIRNRIDAFLTEVTDLVRQAALGAVREVLGATPAPSRSKTTGRRKKAGTRTKGGTRRCW